MKNHEEDTFVSDAKIGKQILPPTHTPQGGVGGLKLELRALCMLSTYSTTELHT